MNTTETFVFQAEAKQLLELMIHSLYTDKDIFLRELISNASDALDRLRFEALTKPEWLSDDNTLEIRLDPDPQGRTLTIHDTGIGMSRDELITNIGTIAKSGTRQLLEQITAADKDDVLVLQQRKLNLGRQINQATAAKRVNRNYAAAAYGPRASTMDVQR